MKKKGDLSDKEFKTTVIKMLTSLRKEEWMKKVRISTNRKQSTKQKP